MQSLQFLNWRKFPEIMIAKHVNEATEHIWMPTERTCWSVTFIRMIQWLPQRDTSVRPYPFHFRKAQNADLKADKEEIVGDGRSKASMGLVLTNYPVKMLRKWSHRWITRKRQLCIPHSLSIVHVVFWMSAPLMRRWCSWDHGRMERLQKPKGRRTAVMPWRRRRRRTRRRFLGCKMQTWEMVFLYFFACFKMFFIF